MIAAVTLGDQDPTAATHFGTLGAVPNQSGVGLKAEHVAQILETEAKVGFFEVHAENYMGDGGVPHRQLTDIRDRYPISLHGVGLSIGGEGPLDKPHLEKLRNLERRYQPGLFSEHLAWSSHDGIYLNDLLPVAYDKPTLDRVCEHIDEVQSVLGRQLLLENPSTYIAFEQSSMSEIDFISQVAQRTGCGLLLDLNNVFVSATNHQYSPQEYLASFPIQHVGELHLGGHAEDQDETLQTLLIDSHDREVCKDVWQLLKDVMSITGPLPTLIEWDNNVPQWPVLMDEASRAAAIISTFEIAR